MAAVLKITSVPGSIKLDERNHAGASFRNMPPRSEGNTMWGIIIGQDRKVYTEIKMMYPTVAPEKEIAVILALNVPKDIPLDQTYGFKLERRDSGDLPHEFAISAITIPVEGALLSEPNGGFFQGEEE